MSKRKIRIAIVGTGTAGYLAALLLSKYLSDKFTIYLIGDFNINNTVGVGEATTLGIKKVFKDINISFLDLISSGNTFKYGIIFEGRNDSTYFHPFYNYNNEILLSFFYRWYIDTKGKISFFNHLYNTSELLNGYIYTDSRLFPFSYHLDLKKLYSLFVSKLENQEKVILLRDKVKFYRFDEKGYINELVLESGKKYG